MSQSRQSLSRKPEIKIIMRAFLHCAKLQSPSAVSDYFRDPHKHHNLCFLFMPSEIMCVDVCFFHGHACLFLLILRMTVLHVAISGTFSAS